MDMRDMFFMSFCLMDRFNNLCLFDFIIFVHCFKSERDSHKINGTIVLQNILIA